MTDSEEMKYEHLRHVVENININETEVPRVDRLSNNIYLFSRSDNCVKLIAFASDKV